MEKGKAAGSSGFNAEMILTGGNDIILAITHLLNCIVGEGKITNDWSLSYIVNSYNNKGDALLRGNYRGLKFLDQVMKVVEHILATIIRTQVDIDAMQFVSCLGEELLMQSILQQVHEKYLGKHKDLYFAFVDLEKAFERVPRKVLWWAIRELVVEQWLLEQYKLCTQMQNLV